MFQARRLHKLERQERKRAAQLNQSENESFSRKTLKLALSSFDNVRTRCRRVCKLGRNLYQRCYKGTSGLHVNLKKYSIFSIVYLHKRI